MEMDAQGRASERRGSRRRTTWSLTLAALVVAIAAAATGCGESSDASAQEIAERKVRITTTTNFITDTVKQVGGDRVEVEALMGPGVDPHLFKASAGDVKTMRDADVIFYGGLQLEGKMDDVLRQLEERQTTVAVSEDMPRESLLDPGGEVAEEHDPHVWFDTELWSFAVKSIRDTLQEKDPQNAAVYDRNAERELAELKELGAYAREQIASIPERQRLLVTSHDAFEYFGRANDLDVTAIQGISTATEATTSDIDRIAKTIADRDVKAVFVESSVPRQTIEAVLAAARERGQEARIGGELFSDAAGDPGTDEGTHVGMVRANVDSIVEGLK